MILVQTLVDFIWLQIEIFNRIWARREKGRYPTQSYDKSSYTDRKIQKATLQHKNATKNFDYTTIADRLRTASWGNNSHPTGLVKPDFWHV